VLNQWRWDNDRENVEKEDKQQTDEKIRTAIIEMHVREEYLNKVTLTEILDDEMLSQWQGYPTATMQAGVRQIMKDLVVDLQRIQYKSPRRIKKRAKKAVKALNKFDRLNDHFIETVEREDICELFEEILHAAKAPDLLDVVEDWREW